MLFDLECDYCGLLSEHQMMSDEIDKWVECPHCGGQLCRRLHRLYTPPMIQGDTVSGGCNYSGYYDEGLGEVVLSKAHRASLMEQKGLTEYNPDPEMKRHRDEMKYIRGSAKPGDPEAMAAVRNEQKTASDKRRNKIVESTMKKAMTGIVPD